MKKSFLLLLFSIISSGIFAQNKKVRFEDIPFEKTVNEIIEILSNNGFIKTEEDELTGNIDSYNPCTITLLTPPENSDTVGGIGVRFPDCNTWQTLQTTYSDLKEKLKQKYGTTFLSVEKFTSRPQPVTDEEKLHALNQGECSYETLFILSSKIIALAIGNMEKNSCQVVLSCIDKDFIQTLANYGNTFQEESEHLQFKGIPITGPRLSFVNKLKELGFKTTYDYNHASALQGRFAGYEPCNIYVISSEQEDFVHTVGVALPEREQWSQLSSDYFSFKKMLIQKYGDPAICTETFQSEFEPSDDQMKMLFTNMDKCKYNTVFGTPNGTILLSIAHNKVDFHDFCYISLAYMDKSNSAIATNQALNDL